MDTNPNLEQEYQTTIDFLFAQLPMYQKIGKAALKKDLTNINALCAVLGNPQQKFACIHIAGTNGKGSTSHTLAAIFQAAGYKTGLYTSPHYIDFRERIRLNGTVIDKQAVVDFVQLIKPQILEIEPSFFEITVAMAFHFFALQGVEMAIIETGLGGRLDSTNIINPVLSIITNISFDHTDMLGDTLPQIAYEKAGIIKQNTPIIIGDKITETAPVFTQKALEVNAPLIFAQDIIELKSLTSSLEFQEFEVQKNQNIWFKKLKTDLTGNYQLKNLRTVFAALTVLQLPYKLSNKTIKEGIKAVKSTTNLTARLQIIQKKPLIIADAAHNEDGIKNLLEYLEPFGFENILFVLGFVKDKDLTKILNLLPLSASYIATQPSVFRQLTVENLSNLLKSKKIPHKSFTSVNFALSFLKENVGNPKIICVTGSSFLVADVLELKH